MYLESKKLAVDIFHRRQSCCLMKPDVRTCSKGTIIRLVGELRLCSAEHRSEDLHANFNPRYPMLNLVRLIHRAALENKVERKPCTHHRTLKGNTKKN